MAIVELIMPKMGESIIEATVINWLKAEGDRVDREETVLEIATDKVDSEVPSPVSGVIAKIMYQKDDVVPIGGVLAHIETEEAGPIASSKPDNIPTIPESDDAPTTLEEAKQTSTSVSAKPSKIPIALSRKSVDEKIPSNVGGRFYSPLVRNIARAEGITLEELNNLKGSGADDRVTKYDLLNYIDLKKLETSSSIKRAETLKTPLIRHQESPDSETVQTRTATFSAHDVIDAPKESQSRDEIIELSRMRKVIAGHMRHSIETSAHVTSFVEADATRLVHWRNKVKEEFQSRYGEKLTFSPLFTEAVIKALGDFPLINASLSEDRLVVKQALNIGIATAMEKGNLIEPVIHNAGELNLHGLAKKLNDVTARARINKLRPEEIQGGTFTISNIGTFGNIMGTPIINQPQLAILALGAIKKKPVIQETSEGDIIAIRHMMFLSLSFDHRVIDGYQGGVFLNRIAHYIETFDVNRQL